MGSGEHSDLDRAIDASLGPHSRAEAKKTLEIRGVIPSPDRVGCLAGALDQIVLLFPFKPEGRKGWWCPGKDSNLHSR